MRGGPVPQFPTVEWTLYFKNTGAQDTPILSQHPGRRHVPSPQSAGRVPPAPSRWQPGHQRRLPAAPDAAARQQHAAPGSSGGRGSDGVWPYFNIEHSGGGTIVVVGWPGQWDGSFARDGTTGLRIRAGQEQTHFKLLPGEEVRTPLIVLQFYRGDWIRAQNVWRRWMIAHNMPRLDGKLPPPLLAGFQRQPDERDA